MKILFSNIGYAKGIDGTLRQHLFALHRHFYSSKTVQQNVLDQLKTIIATEQPDLCCFVEIDRGSWHTAYLNQMHVLCDDDYCHTDIADKYGEKSWLGRMPLHWGKSNGFVARQAIPFERLYMAHGTKRLFYRLQITPGVQLLFGHFSLQRRTRARQFHELAALMAGSTDQFILLGDFNVMHGFAELADLCRTTGLMILNDEDTHTFTFHNRRLALDLCLCSPELASRITLNIIPQPFSDHAALVVTLI